MTCIQLVMALQCVCDLYGFALNEISLSKIHCTCAMMAVV